MPQSWSARYAGRAIFNKILSLCKTDVLLLPSFRNYCIELHCKLRETVRCLLPAGGADRMAHDDGPFAAACREVALRAAAHIAQPRTRAASPSRAFPQWSGGIRSPRPCCCRRTILMSSLRGISTTAIEWYYSHAMSKIEAIRLIR
jgi:hypothetical protein